MTNFGGYKTFCPQLTEYCWGCVSGGVDAPADHSRIILLCYCDQFAVF